MNQKTSEPIQETNKFDSEYKVSDQSRLKIRESESESLD